MNKILAAILLTLSFGVYAQAPDDFDSGKKAARNKVYMGNLKDFYCGCSYEPSGDSGGTLVNGSCGYSPRSNFNTGPRLEWEHVVPASYYGNKLTCWKQPETFDRCVKANGSLVTKRECCRKVNDDFNRMEGDLHNLTPSVGELNNNRSDLPYGVVEGEQYKYGRCEFTITAPNRTRDDLRRVAEPPDGIKGDAARISLYMILKWKIKFSDEDVAMFRAWSVMDPVDKWELERDRRIKAIQGDSNPYVTGEGSDVQVLQF